MIKMIKGTYGLMMNGCVEAMTKHSAPFSLPKAREAELVAAGVAVYVTEGADKTQGDEIVDEFPEYNEEMKLSKLKEIAKVYGIDASSMKSKKEVIEAIDAARNKQPDVDADALAE